MSLGAKIHGVVASSRVSAPPPTGGSTRRFWRVQDAFGGSDNMQYGEVEFRETVNGADLTGSGVGISSSIFSSSFLPEFAFDDILTNGWAASGYVSQWVGYDFGAGAEVSVGEIVLSPRGAFGNASPNYALISYSEDGTNWTPYSLIPGANLNGGVTKALVVTDDLAAEAATDLSVPHRYFRFLSQQRNLSAFQLVGDIELLDFFGDNVALTGTASADREQGASFVAANAFDGNPATIWADSGEQTPAWLQWDFGAGNEQLIHGYALRAGDNNQTGMWAGWKFQVSDDGIAWTTLDWQHSQNAWGSGERREFSISGVSPPTFVAAGEVAEINVAAFMKPAEAEVTVSEVKSATFLKIEAGSASVSEIGASVFLIPQSNLSLVSECNVAVFMKEQ